MKSVSCYISIIYYEYCTSWLSIISCYTLLKQTFIYVCHCITNNIHLFSRTEQNIIYSVNLYSVYCLNKQRNWWHIQKKSNRHVNTVACETVNTLSNKHKNQTIHRNKHSTTFYTCGYLRDEPLKLAVQFGTDESFVSCSIFISTTILDEAICCVLTNSDVVPCLDFEINGGIFSHI